MMGKRTFRSLDGKTTNPWERPSGELEKRLK